MIHLLTTMVGIDHSRYDNNFTSTLRTSTFLFSFIHHFILLRHAVILYYTWYNITTNNIMEHNIQYYINIFIVIGFSIFHSNVLIRVTRSKAVWLQNPIVCFECSSPLWCGQTVNRFAWLVRISGVEYFDGKRQASKFARFKMLMNKKIIKIDRDIGKRPTLGCHLVSCRSGDHD